MTLAIDFQRDILNDAPRVNLKPHARQGLVFRETHSGKIKYSAIPDFSTDDWHLRIVVAQTAWIHLHKGPWKRCPETFCVDHAGLVKLLAERLDTLSKKDQRLLTRFNTTKDYVAVLSACAYLKWRMRWQTGAIANELHIPVRIVSNLLNRLKNNAIRLGFPVKRNKTWKGLPTKMSRDEVRALMQEVFSRPEFRAMLSAAAKVTQNRPEEKTKRSVATKAAWVRPGVRDKWRVAQKAAGARPEVKANRRRASNTRWARSGAQRRQSAALKAAHLRKFLKTVAWG